MLAPSHFERGGYTAQIDAEETVRKADLSEFGQSQLCRIAGI